MTAPPHASNIAAVALHATVFVRGGRRVLSPSVGRRRAGKTGRHVTEKDRALARFDTRRPRQAVNTPADVVAFVLGAAVSLGSSWVLVSRIERMGNRLGVTEAMLGLIAALAADAPEITSAVSALIGHQQEIGSGVVVGSNVFNLAALLGLGAVAAGWVALHRRVRAADGRDLAVGRRRRCARRLR